MPGRKLFSPHSRQQDERLISRSQSNWYDGIFSDLAASLVSLKGLWKLTNYVNFGKYLIGRAGSKRVSKTNLPTISGRGPYSATKSSSTVTLSSGDITSADIGNYVYWSDTRKYERITAVASTTSFTVHTSATHSAVTDMTLTGAFNGGLYHSGKEKAVLHIHDKIYETDYTMVTYTKCPVNAVNSPDKYKTVFDERDENIYIYSNKSIFRVDLKYNPAIVYPINRGIPTVKVTNSGSKSDTTPYGYRYLYTMTRLSGTGFRDRNTSEVVIEVETGSTKYNKTTYDYGETWLAAELSSSGNIVGTFTVPLDPIKSVPYVHFTHISVYRTLNVGPKGYDPVTGGGNNTELYIWVADIPIAKAFTASQSGTTVTSTVGNFGSADVGSRLYYANGWSSIIDSYTDVNNVEVEDTQTVASQSASLGNGEIFTASQATTTITKTGGRSFTATDEGRLFFWADGRSSILKTYLTTTTFTAHNSQTVASQGATMNAESRKFNDVTADDTLRISAGAWPLFSRYYDAIPQSNSGAISDGFMFAHQRYGSYVYYCEIPDGFEYLMGYYYPTQFMHFKDQIEALSTAFSDKLAVYCKNSTHNVPINVYEQQLIESVGVEITTITGQNVADKDIGCVDYGSIQSFGEGKEIMVNSDYGIRVFDGTKYTENKIYNKIMKRMLKLLPAFGSSYDEENGYMLYGKEPS